MRFQTMAQNYGEIKIPTKVIPKRPNGDENSLLLDMINGSREKEQAPKSEDIQPIQSPVETASFQADSEPNNPTTQLPDDQLMVDVQNLTKI